MVSLCLFLSHTPYMPCRSQTKLKIQAIFFLFLISHYYHIISFLKKLIVYSIFYSWRMYLCICIYTCKKTRKVPIFYNWYINVKLTIWIFHSKRLYTLLSSCRCTSPSHCYLACMFPCFYIYLLNKPKPLNNIYFPTIFRFREFVYIIKWGWIIFLFSLSHISLSWIVQS